MKCEDVGVRGCRSRRQQSYKTIAHWSFDFLQNALTVWYSKRQNTVESSTFGSEFVAMRIAKDMAIALRYKLRMFGITIDGAADVFCDNQGVVKNMSLPESVLSKKHNVINYHAV